MKYSIYYHENGYQTKGNKDTYEEALELYVSTPAGITTVLLRNDDDKIIRAYGFDDRIQDLRNKYNASLEIAGEATDKHEVYWHDDGKVHRSLHDDYNAALSAFQNIAPGLSKIVVRSNDLRVLDVFGFNDTLAVIKGQAHVQ